MYQENGKKFATQRMYRHFKGEYYYVHSLAYHTETEELMVVYQALYGENKMYVRPYAMFIEEVPKEKENPTGQRYRFECCDLNHK